jgi:glycosyltransferase involved in cell wall biosynthesis
MHTMYLPIFAPGTYYELQRRTKRGLRDALAKAGDVREIDYLSISPADLENVLRTELTNYDPDLLLTQIQGPDPLTAQIMASIRVSYPDIPVVNWSGDYWPERLIAPAMLDILRQVDLQLVVNGSVLDVYADEGIRAAYCPFGYEAIHTPLPKLPHQYDVVFLGNNYSEKRQQLYDALRSLDCHVGVYGSGWAQSDGECNYDFAMAEALYLNATLAISDNQFPDARGYMSDRPIQVLAAGGAVLLQQTVRDLEAMTGLNPDKHYVEWTDFDDLEAKVAEWLHAPQERQQARRISGMRLVHERHLWEHRVEQLVTDWLPLIRARQAA